jgi:lauroyl/myristoyl acyltransferase
MRSYLLYYADLFRLGVYSPQELHRRARFERKEILDAALAEGRGVVVVITHSGNWDLAGAFVATQISGVTSVAERLKPEELFQAFVDVRARYGLTVLPHKGGSRPPTEILEETLREGRIVALAADRDFTRRGITAEFFGHRTTFPSGPLRLAQATGAALLYACVWTDVDTTVLTISNPIHVANRSDEDIMQEIAIKFEGGIKAHVDNWHMLQQIWPDHPREWGGRPR